jgi:hypothetical protein
MNITKVNGSYSKELLENIDLITAAKYNSSVSLSSMKQTVLAIIEPAFIGTVAKQRFIGYVHNCQSKNAVYKLCWNTIHKAMSYKPTRTY